MTRQELIDQSEAYIRQILKEQISPQVRVFLYGSRARRDNRWNPDYNLWVDGELSRATLSQLAEQLDDSFVPFKVDIVTTPQLKGRFAARVKQEAKPWM
jgi:predicted nucleotidyltransferase